MLANGWRTGKCLTENMADGSGMAFKTTTMSDVQAPTMASGGDGETWWDNDNYGMNRQFVWSISSQLNFPVYFLSFPPGYSVTSTRIWYRCFDSILTDLHTLYWLIWNVKELLCWMWVFINIQKVAKNCLTFLHAIPNQIRRHCYSPLAAATKRWP